MKCYDLVNLEEQESKRFKTHSTEDLCEELFELKHQFAFTTLADPQPLDDVDSIDEDFHYYDEHEHSYNFEMTPGKCHKRRVVRLLHTKASKTSESPSQKLLKNPLALVP